MFRFAGVGSSDGPHRNFSVDRLVPESFHNSFSERFHHYIASQMSGNEHSLQFFWAFSSLHCSSNVKSCYNINAINVFSSFFPLNITSFINVSTYVLLVSTNCKALYWQRARPIEIIISLEEISDLSVIIISMDTFIPNYIIITFISLQIHSANGLFPPVLRESNPIIIFLVLLLYGITSITFCFTISCFFNRR